jgi:adenylate cyclase
MNHAQLPSKKESKDPLKADSMITNIVHLYAICTCLLTFYSAEVSPVVASRGILASLTCWIFSACLGIVLRVLLFRQNQRRMTIAFLQQERSFLTLPLAECCSDVVVWFGIGLLASGFMWFYYSVTWQSSLQMTFACVACGLLVGVLNFLDMEREVMNFLVKQLDASNFKPRSPLLSVASKFTFVLVIVMIVSGVVIGFMLLDDVRSLKEAGAPSDAAIYNEMLWEVGIVTVIMLAFSVAIIRRFSRNLNKLFGIEIETLEKVEQGQYGVRVPVVSADEFGIIAAQTNEMILGLKQRDFIRETFGRYVTKEVRDLILSQTIPLAGEARNVTIMFCDIRGFTSHVASRPAVQVVKRLNQYFTEMSKAIENHNGLVLQFIGDEIEAVFGAPLHLENHPEMALNAAIDMRRSLFELNQKWIQDGDAPWKHGIGIHTGEVLAGNIGSPDRLSYLMVGDTVNLASRIQELTKKYDCDILISDETRRALSNCDNIQYVGSETVRGMAVETRLYKLL